MLLAQGLCKSFAGIPAVVDAGITILPGQIHAVLGENGAGKSTLMNLIAGLYFPDSGVIEFHGKPLRFSSPADALNAGIGMVHQQFKLVRSMTVAENFAAFAPGFMFSPKVWQKKILELSETFGLRVDPNRRIDDLSMGEQQRVEILRLLSRNVQLLILDEPTAVLTPQEADALLETLQKLARNQRAILMITHKLREVFAAADTLTVLRRGRTVLHQEVAKTNQQEIAGAMMGEALIPSLEKSPCTQSDAESVRLKVSGLIGTILDKVDLRINAGVITALVGISGNGQDQLFQSLLGTYLPSHGELWIEGKKVSWNSSLRQRQHLGLAFIHPNVRRDALVSNMSVTENLLLDRIGRKPYLTHKAQVQYAKTLSEQFSLIAPSLEAPASVLSGGNMQKIALARELARNPKILIAMNPTRGLDMAASAFVHQQILKLAREGAAILYITEDLDEAYAISDFLMVIGGGRITLAQKTEETSRQAVGLAMGAKNRVSA